MRVEARSTLITYGWNRELLKDNEEQGDDNKDEEDDDDSRPSNIEHSFILAWTIGPFGLLVDFYILLFLLKLIQSS